MRYTVKKSVISVIGNIWMPNVECAHQYELRQYDIDNMTDENGQITRESVEDWLSTNSGDFRYITDFHADIELNDENILIPWENDENEYVFSDLMFPCEE